MIYKLPKNLDDELQTIVVNALNLIIPFHLIMAIWTYGCPRIFYDDFDLSHISEYLASKTNQAMELTNKINIGDSYFMELIDRVQKPQNYLLVLILALIITVFLLNVFLYKPMMTLLKMCFKTCSKKALTSLKNPLRRYRYLSM